MWFPNMSLIDLANRFDYSPEKWDTGSNIG